MVSKFFTFIKIVLVLEIVFFILYPVLTAIPLWVPLEYFQVTFAWIQIVLAYIMWPDYATLVVALTYIVLGGYLYFGQKRKLSKFEILLLVVAVLALGLISVGYLTGELGPYM